MNGSEVSHFSEGLPPFPRAFLDSERYGQALDVLVIACVDVVLVWGDRILLGKRNQPPRPHWWVIGGRMLHGESPLEAVQRKLQEEAGLAGIEENRLDFIGVFSTRFSERSQPPIRHGLHSVNLTYRLQLTDAEAEMIQLDSAEYGRSHWWRATEVNNLLDPEATMDQALERMVQLSIDRGK
ncbi:MAG: NUDIX domain-containing protein [Cyanophyceae cyanobacterium]